MNLERNFPTVVYVLLILISGHSRAHVTATTTMSVFPPPVAALVRVENNRVTCVRYVRTDEIDLERLQLPLCTTEGAVGEHVNVAMNLARDGAAVRSVAASHAGFGLVGCLYGATMSLFGTSLKSQIASELDHTTGPATASIAGGVVGTGLLFAVGEPTGHILSAGVGYVLCSGGITYIVFRETHRSENTANLEVR